ncbi:MAG: peptidoglycan DD-metalloendopeptidase family protein [Candidatus Omnitrophica bacterium]|nr:peptidoglycan DD-metalloendopeptidase family protein [Candidatus Omnitrophota bacterium]
MKFYLQAEALLKNSGELYYLDEKKLVAERIRECNGNCSGSPVESENIIAARKELFQHLRWLRNLPHIDAIPDKIIHSTTGEWYKARKGWFVGVKADLWNILEEQLIVDPKLKEANDLIDEVLKQENGAASPVSDEEFRKLKAFVDGLDMYVDRIRNSVLKIKSASLCKEVDENIGEIKDAIRLMVGCGRLSLLEQARQDLPLLWHSMEDVRELDLGAMAQMIWIKVATLGDTYDVPSFVEAIFPLIKKIEVLGSLLTTVIQIKDLPTSVADNGQEYVDWDRLMKMLKESSSSPVGRGNIETLYSLSSSPITRADRKSGGESKWAAFGRFKSSLQERLPVLPIAELKEILSISNVGELRKALQGKGIFDADVVESKFLLSAMEPFKELLGDVQESKTISSKRVELGWAGAGRHLYCLKDTQGYVLKYPNSESFNYIDHYWLNPLKNIAMRILEGLAAPTVYFDSRKGEEDSLFFRVKSFGAMEEEVVIVQREIIPWLEYLKRLARKNNIAACQNTIDRYRQIIINIYKRGAVDTDRTGVLANYGIEKNGLRFFSFDFGDLSESINEASKFIRELNDINQIVLEQVGAVNRRLREYVNKEYDAKGLFIDRDFCDENDEDIFGRDLKGADDIEQFRLRFPLEKETIRDLFAGSSPIKVDLRAPPERIISFALPSVACGKQSLIFQRTRVNYSSSPLHNYSDLMWEFAHRPTSTDLQPAYPIYPPSLREISLAAENEYQVLVYRANGNWVVKRGNFFGDSREEIDDTARILREANPEICLVSIGNKKRLEITRRADFVIASNFPSCQFFIISERRMSKFMWLYQNDSLLNGNAGFFNNFRTVIEWRDLGDAFLQGLADGISGRALGNGDVWQEVRRIHETFDKFERNRDLSEFVSGLRKYYLSDIYVLRFEAVAMLSRINPVEEAFWAALLLRKDARMDAVISSLEIIERRMEWVEKGDVFRALEECALTPNECYASREIFLRILTRNEAQKVWGRSVEGGIDEIMVAMLRKEFSAGEQIRRLFYESRSWAVRNRIKNFVELWASKKDLSGEDLNVRSGALWLKDQLGMNSSSPLTPGSLVNTFTPTSSPVSPGKLYGIKSLDELINIVKENQVLALMIENIKRTIPIPNPYIDFRIDNGLRSTGVLKEGFAEDRILPAKASFNYLADAEGNTLGIKDIVIMLNATLHQGNPRSMFSGIAHEVIELNVVSNIIGFSLLSGAPVKIQDLNYLSSKGFSDWLTHIEHFRFSKLLYSDVSDMHDNAFRIFEGTPAIIENKGEIGRILRGARAVKDKTFKLISLIQDFMLANEAELKYLIEAHKSFDYSGKHSASEINEMIAAEKLLILSAIKCVGLFNKDDMKASSPAEEGSMKKELIRRRGIFDTPFQVFGSTFFWNYSTHLKYLRGIIKSLIEKRISKLNRFLYLWSAGCGLGMEPYTIAIIIVKLFRDYMLDIGEWDIKIFVTDRNPALLEEAQRGEYLAEEIRANKSKGFEEGLPFGYRTEDYFDFKGDVYKLKPEIRKLVEFSYLDLTEDKSGSVIKNIDVIFCQWVFEYLEEDGRRPAAKALVSSLRNGGFVFIGGMEESIFSGLAKEGILSPYHEDEIYGGYIYHKEKSSVSSPVVITTRDLIDTSVFQKMGYVDYPVPVEAKPLAEFISECMDIVIADRRQRRLYLRRYSSDFDFFEAVNYDLRQEEIRGLIEDPLNRLILVYTDNSEFACQIDKVRELLIPKYISGANFKIEDTGLDAISRIGIFLYPSGELVLHNYNTSYDGQKGLIKTVKYKDFLSDLSAPEITDYPGLLRKIKLRASSPVNRCLRPFEQLLTEYHIGPYHNAVLDEFVRSEKYGESIGYTAADNYLPKYQYLLGQIYKRLGDLGGRPVVELGCGPGVVVEILRRLGGADIIGVEADPRFVSFAQKHGVPLLQGTLMHIPDKLTGRSFDLTFSNWFLDVLADIETSSGDPLRYRRLEHSERLEVLNSIAALTSPGAFSIHATYYPMPFTKDEFIRAGFEVIKYNNNRTLAILRKELSSSPVVGAGEWKALRPVFPLDAESLPNFKRFVFRKGTGYGSRWHWGRKGPYRRGESFRFHPGIDFFEYESLNNRTYRIPMGTPIKAVLSGEVISGSRRLSLMEEEIIIQSAGRKAVRYVHIASFVNKGDEVKAGEVIGTFHRFRLGTHIPHLHLDLINKNLRLPNPESYRFDVWYIRALLSYEYRALMRNSFDPFLLWEHLATESRIEHDDTNLLKNTTSSPVGAYVAGLLKVSRVAASPVDRPLAGLALAQARSEIDLMFSDLLGRYGKEHLLKPEHNLKVLDKLASLFINGSLSREDLAWVLEVAVSKSSNASELVIYLDQVISGIGTGKIIFIDYQSVLGFLKDHLFHYPYDVDAALIYLQLIRGTSQLKETIFKDIGDLIRMRPFSAAAYFIRSILYGDREDFAHCLEDLSRAIEYACEPKDRALYLYHKLILMDRILGQNKPYVNGVSMSQEIENTVKEFLKHKALLKHWGTPHWESISLMILANVLFYKGKYQEAEEELNFALANENIARIEKAGFEISGYYLSQAFNRRASISLFFAEERLITAELKWIGGTPVAEEDKTTIERLLNQTGRDMLLAGFYNKDYVMGEGQIRVQNFMKKLQLITKNDYTRFLLSVPPRESLQILHQAIAKVLLDKGGYQFSLGEVRAVMAADIDEKDIKHLKAIEVINTIQDSSQLYYRGMQLFITRPLGNAI